MQEVKKLDQTEIDSIVDLRKRMSDKVLQFGELEVEMQLTIQRKEMLESEKVKLISDFEILQKEEKDTADKLNEKYGQGTLNIDTGEFIPAQLLFGSFV